MSCISLRISSSFFIIEAFLAFQVSSHCFATSCTFASTIRPQTLDRLSLGGHARGVLFSHREHLLSIDLASPGCAD